MWVLQGNSTGSHAGADSSTHSGATDNANLGPDVGTNSSSNASTEPGPDARACVSTFSYSQRVLHIYADRLPPTWLARG